MKQKLNFFFIILIHIPVNLFSVNRSQSIPGIDPLPMAIQEGVENPQSSITSDTPVKKPAETQQDFPDFPKIRNIRVEPDSTYPFSARISWEFHLLNNTPIYVVRYTRPISTKEILLNSYNLTSPPIDPKVNTFIDKDIPEGVYYYAVITSFELSKEGMLLLKPNQNYTTNPFIVYRDRKDTSTTNVSLQTSDFKVDRSNLTPDDFQVNELMALNSEEGVVLNWQPPKIDNISFKIYRGLEPLDTEERINTAKLLGETVNPHFLDKNFVEGKDFFYGVTVYDNQTKKEYKNLKFRSSYISFNYKKPKVEYQYLNFLPTSLMAYLVNKDTIQLFWVDAGESVQFYKVYRNEVPITNETILRNSGFLGNIKSGSIGFLDKNLKAGKYFYAVVPVLSNNNEIIVFQPSRTFTTYGIVIFPSQDEKTEKPKVVKTETLQNSFQNYIKDISLRIENENDVRITWDYRKEGSQNIKILIYRSSIPIRKYEELKDNAEYIGEFPIVSGVYVDKKLLPGSYYYNFIEFNSEKSEILAFYNTKRALEIASKQDKNLPLEPRTQKNESDIKQESKKEAVKEEPKNIQSKEQTSKPEDKKETLEDKKQQSEQPSIHQNLSKKIDIDQNLKEVQRLISIYAYEDAENQLNQLLDIPNLSSLEKGKIKFHLGFLKFRQYYLLFTTTFYD